jgi:ribosomal protein L24E
LTNKLWYVYTENKENDYKNSGVIQYFTNKKEAEKLLKKIVKLRPSKLSWVDSIWKEDKEKPVSFLHGKKIIKVENILDYLAV